jgi:Stress responsive A/B Barrel Domain
MRPSRPTTTESPARSLLHHVVCLRVPDPVQAEELANRLNALAELIPVIRSYTAGVDVVDTPVSYEVGLHSTFDDVEALEVYRAHPAHQAVLQLIAEVSTERVAVDWFD